jgi:acyl-CoA thioesterase FadM
VTLEFNIRYRKPIPLDTQLRVVGRITKEDSRFFEGTGELLLPDGEIAATGAGRYMKMAIDRIADFDIAAQEWKVAVRPDDPAEISLS